MVLSQFPHAGTRAQNTQGPRVIEWVRLATNFHKIAHALQSLLLPDFSQNNLHSLKSILTPGGLLAVMIQVLIILSIVTLFAGCKTMYLCRLDSYKMTACYCAPSWQYSIDGKIKLINSLRVVSASKNDNMRA